MGAHVKVQASAVPPPASPIIMGEVSAHDGGYRTARWSPLSLGLTLFVQALPVVIGLWVWRPALVQVAPAAPMAVFDVAMPEPPAPETPVAEPAADSEMPVEIPTEPTPVAPAMTKAAPIAPMVAIPTAIATPAKAMPPAPQPAPPPRPTPAAPSQKPADWQSLILGRLNMVKAYPASARARRQQGVAMIRFTLDRKGNVLQAALAQSSGFALLDREAIALPKRASPLPPPPEDVKGERIELVVPVEFHF